MGAAPFAQALREAPESIRPFLVGTLWTRERLWALELPAVSVALADLEPLLELPWWTDGDRRFCLSPATVLAGPGLHVDHDRRIAEADMGFPLHLTRLDGRLTILACTGWPGPCTSAGRRLRLSSCLLRCSAHWPSQIETLSSPVVTDT